MFPHVCLPLCPTLIEREVGRGGEVDRLGVARVHILLCSGKRQHNDRHHSRPTPGVRLFSIPSFSSRVFCLSLTLCSPLESIDKTSHLVGIRCERHMQRRRQRPCEDRCQDIKHTRARKAEVNQGGGSLRCNKVIRVWVCLLFLFPHVCFLLIVSSPPTFLCVPFPLARHLTVDDRARARARARARRPPLTR